MRLIFKEESKALEFESLLRKLPRLYRRRTPHDESIITDITVNDMKISSLSLPTPLTRVYETDYNKIADDTNPSDDCDTESNYSSSVASPVSVNEESRLRLVDNESSHNLFYQKPEKCHLLSQKKFPKEKNDPNNVVFMCRLLHQHFDGIDSVEGIPTFIMKYVSHSSLPSPGSVNGKTVNVYETIVKIVFKNQELKDELSKDFKDYTVLSSTEIQFSLCSPDPVRAKRCIESKAEETQMIWNSYDGSIS